MRLGKTGVGLLILSAFLASFSSANAQTKITLGTSTQLVTFKGMGSPSPNELSITLGSCFGSNCRVQGTAFGVGGLASGPAPFSLTSSKNSITATLANATLGTWDVSQTAPIIFKYGAGGSLLTGDLNLLTFQQSPSSTAGIFNVNGTADLTITGGSLAAAFTSAGGIMDVNVAFRSASNIMSLLGTTNSKFGTFAGGQLLPTPEPSAFAIFLLGASMLLLGSLLRGKVLSNA